MKKQRIIGAALAAALMLGAYPGEYAEAAAVKPAQTEKTKTEKTQEEQPDGAEGMAQEELAEYYGDSVFIGDSIMLGFRNYSAKKETFVHDIQFLAAGSYSARNALKPVEGKNVHPMYKGKKYQLWDAVPLIGSKRAFILFGMNDIGIVGLETSRDNYKAVIDRMVEASPDMEIHIISATYTLKDKGKGPLNNENIASYNELLQEMAKENDWGYIDLCTPISDKAGNLAAEYCSDGFAHLNKSAYAVWEEELTRYAEEQSAVDEAETEEAEKDGETKGKTAKEETAKDKNAKEETEQKTPVK